MNDCKLAHRIKDYTSIRDVIAYFKRSEASLWAAANSLENENLSDELIERIYSNRNAYIEAMNKWEPETLVDVCQRLGVWVLQHYPDKSEAPEGEWDRLVVNSYFQLAGLLGIASVREE